MMLNKFRKYLLVSFLLIIFYPFSVKAGCIIGKSYPGSNGIFEVKPEFDYGSFQPGTQVKVKITGVDHEGLDPGLSLTFGKCTTWYDGKCFFGSFDSSYVPWVFTGDPFTLMTFEKYISLPITPGDYYLGYTFDGGPTGVCGEQGFVFKVLNPNDAPYPPEIKGPNEVYVDETYSGFYAIGTDSEFFKIELKLLNGYYPPSHEAKSKEPQNDLLYYDYEHDIYLTDGRIISGVKKGVSDLVCATPILIKDESKEDLIRQRICHLPDVWEHLGNSPSSFIVSKKYNPELYSLLKSGDSKNIKKIDLRVRAIDRWGNQSAWSIYPITIVKIPPPTLELTANPTVIEYYTTTKLIWHSTGADKCVGLEGFFNVGGEVTLSNKDYGGWSTILKETTKFTIECTGAGGSVKRSVTVRVGPPPTTKPKVEIVPVKADKVTPETEKPFAPTASEDKAAYLSYSISGAESCSGSYTYSIGNPPVLKTSPLWSVPRNQTVVNYVGSAVWTGDIRYTVVCKNSFGETKAEAVVRVGPNNPPEKAIFMEQKSNPIYNKLHMSDYVFKYPGYWNYSIDGNGDYVLNIGAYSYDKDKHAVKFLYYLDGLSGPVFEGKSAMVLPKTAGLESLIGISPLYMTYHQIKIPKQQVEDFGYAKRIHIKTCDPYNACSENSVFVYISDPKKFLDIGLRIKAKLSTGALVPISIAAEAGTPTSPLRIKKRTSSGATKIFGIALVPPGDPKATGWIVKVKDKNGVLKPMALRKLD